MQKHIGTIKLRLNILNNFLKNLKKLFLILNDKPKYCPVCKKEAESFMPLPEQFKGKVVIKGKEYIAYKEAEMLNYKEYSCPHCGASDRERFYAIYMQNLFFKEYNVEDVKMVHFAPEASLKNFLNQHAFNEYRTADLMMEGVDDKEDLTELNYDDNYFDFFICSHMLEHIPDDKKAMQELYRILKPGGKGILVVPILLGLDETYEDPSIVSEEERLLHFWQEDHVRMYSKKGYLARLKQVGFSVKEYGAKEFSNELLNKVAITSRSILYVVEK